MTTNQPINQEATTNPANQLGNALGSTSPAAPTFQSLPPAFISAMKEAAENKANVTGAVNRQRIQPRIPIGSFVAVTKEAVLEKNQPSKFGINDRIALTFDVCVNGEMVSLRSTYWIARTEDSVFCRHLSPLLGRDPRKGFNISELINVTCMLTITHSTNEDGTFSNVESIQRIHIDADQPITI